MERPGPLHPQQEPERDQSDHRLQEDARQGGERSPPAPSETPPDPGPDTSAECGEVGIKDGGEDCGTEAGVDRGKLLSR